MAGRSSTSVKKRQKELARQDKAKEKAAKRAQRSQEKPTRPPGSGPEIDLEYTPDIGDEEQWQLPH